MDYNLKNLSNIYNLDDLDDLDDINCYKINDIIIDEIKTSELKNCNNFLKKFIFLINDNKIYSLKCEFYSGNIININIKNYMINFNSKPYIAIGKLLNYINNYVCLTNFKDLNNNSINNIKIYFPCIENTYDYIENNMIIQLYRESIIHINIESNIEENKFNNIIFELIFCKYYNFLASEFICGIKSNLVSYIYFDGYSINCDNFINKYGYINLNKLNINKKYKNIDIIFKYVYNNKKLYLLLIKFGNIIFNDNNKCKLCEQLYKSFNNNNFIFKEIFKNIILCSYHYKIYFKKLKCLNYIDIDMDTICNILSKNI